MTSYGYTLLVNGLVYNRSNPHNCFSPIKIDRHGIFSTRNLLEEKAILSIQHILKQANDINPVHQNKIEILDNSTGVKVDVTDRILLRGMVYHNTRNIQCQELKSVCKSLFKSILERSTPKFKKLYIGEGFRASTKKELDRHLGSLLSGTNNNIWIKMHKFFVAFDDENDGAFFKLSLDQKYKITEIIDIPSKEELQELVDNLKFPKGK